MNNLLILLVCIFVGVALMVMVTGRYAKPADAQASAKLQRWIMPLVGLLLVLGALKYFVGGG